MRSRTNWKIDAGPDKPMRGERLSKARSSQRTRSASDPELSFELTADVGFVPTVPPLLRHLPFLLRQVRPLAIPCANSIRIGTATFAAAAGTEAFAPERAQNLR